MTSIFDKGKEIILRNKIGSGAEAEIYLHPKQHGYCVKLYKKPISQEQIEKLLILSEERYSALRSQFAIPIRLVSDTRGRPCGFVMNKFDVFGQLHQLSDVGDRDHIAPFADAKFLLKVAINLCDGLALAHSLDLVLGDLSDRNLGFTSTGDVVFFDVDSCQIRNEQRTYPARMGVAEFVDPRARDTNGRWNFDKEADEYSLCINLFKLLFRGRHPFAGAIQIPSGQNTILQIEDLMHFGININADGGTKHSRVRRVETQPSTSEILPSPICNWINEVLSDPFDKENRVEASMLARNLKLYRNSIQHCKNDRSHIWMTKSSDCPWCERYKAVQRTRAFAANLHEHLCIVEKCRRFAREDSHWCDYHWLVPPNYQSQSKSTSTSTWLSSIHGFHYDTNICGAQNKDGSECQKRPLKGNKRCHHHFGQWRAAR